MMSTLVQRIQILLLVAAVAACSTDGADIGPTIADLGEQPPLLKSTAEIGRASCRERV
jgi:hypothetical protein